MDKMCPRQRGLFEGDRIVTGSNLDVEDIQIASLFSLYGVSAFVESTELQDELAAKHVHSYLEVHPRSDINPKVVCLNHRFRLEDARRHLEEWGIIIELVEVGLLLLSEGEREVGLVIASSAQGRPRLLVIGFELGVCEQDSQLSSWRESSCILSSMRRRMTKLDSVGSGRKRPDQARTRRTLGYHFRVLVRNVSQGERELRVLGIESHDRIVLRDREGDGVLSVHFAELHWPREKDVASVPSLRWEGVLTA